MTWSRREVLATLGVASAQAILLACGPRARPVRPATEVSEEVRAWLREAVARLRGAGFSGVHVLAVSRRRTTAAIDVLGAGVARSTSDGVVLTVRDRDGMRREQVTNDLSRDGIAAAVAVLAGKAKPASVDFGATPALARPPADLFLTDGALLARVGAMLNRDRGISSRIVYSAGALDVDDAHVWSIAPGRDLEQRLVRVRKSLTRVAWNGTRPIVSEVARAWSGGIDAQDLSDAEIIGARDTALELMTPRAFEEGEHVIALEPAVAASLVDAAVRALLTTTALRKPEVARRLAVGAAAAAPLLTIVDDPTVAAAYGSFRFDDEGESAAAVKLLDRGTLVGRLADRAGVEAKLAATAGRGRRPGHVGVVEPAPSHLRVVPGTIDEAVLVEDGLSLEGALGALVDPSSDRVVIAASRARERKAGRRTGRVFADVELVGELRDLISSLTGISQQTRSIGLRDEVDGQPHWRSIDAPWLRARGFVRARRRAT